MYLMESASGEYVGPTDGKFLVSAFGEGAEFEICGDSLTKESLYSRFLLPPVQLMRQFILLLPFLRHFFALHLHKSCHLPADYLQLPNHVPIPAQMSTWYWQQCPETEESWLLQKESRLTYRLQKLKSMSRTFWGLFERSGDKMSP